MQNKPLRTNFVVRVAFVLIFIFLFISVINLQVEMNDLRKERDARIEIINQLQDDVDEYELRLSETIDDEYIERVAREKLGLCKPNEIIFVNGIKN